MFGTPVPQSAYAGHHALDGQHRGVPRYLSEYMAKTAMFGTQLPIRVYDRNSYVWYPGAYPSTKTAMNGAQVPQSKYPTKHALLEVGERPSYLTDGWVLLVLCYRFLFLLFLGSGTSAFFHKLIKSDCGSFQCVFCCALSTLGPMATFFSPSHFFAA